MATATLEKSPESQNGLKRDSTEAGSDSKTSLHVPAPAPPDGGWGWVVVFASFMIHIIADGVTFSIGIFFVEFLEYFHGTTSQTAWISSILVGVTLGTGPIASALTNKFGCRIVTIIGGVIAAAGCVLSAFATSIAFLCFSFGFVTGLGFGLIYLPAIVSVTYYFEKRRAFATGLAVCGSGVGTFMFAPISEYLVESYGWQGALIIEAGIILNCVVCGALMRPLEGSSLSRTSSTSSADSGKGSSELVSSNSEYQKCNKNCNSNQKVRHPEEVKPLINGVRETSNVLAPSEQPTRPKRQRLITVGPIGDMNEDDLLGIPERFCRSNPDLNTVSGSPIMSRGTNSLHPNAAKHIMRHHHSKHHHRSHHSLLHSESGVMYRKDILYQGSLLEIPQYKSNHDLYVASITSIPRETKKKAPTKGICHFLTCPKSMADVFSQMTDISLLKDVLYVLFAISNFLTSIGFNVPYVYLPDRAVKLGYSKADGARLISVVGIANTIGRVILGYISDSKRVNRLYIYSGGLTLCGVASALSFLCNDMKSLSAYAAFFGLSIGCYVSLTSVLLVDLLGLERLTSAFGLLLLFQGVASLIGPPLAGLMYDMTQDYDSSFYMMGAVVGVSGAMLFVIPCIRRWLHRKQGTQLTHNSNNHADIEKQGNQLKVCQQETNI